MAAKKKTKRKKSTAIANWDEELAKQAEVAAGMEESVASGQFFSLQGGQLSFNDAPIANNQMAVVILDSILENVYYEAAYDPDDPQGPTCFAFGRANDEMGPHDVVVTPQSEDCESCPMNEWGSADVGRGKACRNSRRLAMIPAGTMVHDDFEPFEDEAKFKTASIAFMRLPVTSVKGYAAFVKQVAGALKRPPHGVFTKVSVVPDPKTQFKVVFEPLDLIPGDLIGPVMERHEEAMSIIDFPYEPAEDKPEPAKKTKKKTANKKTAKRKTRRKY